MDENTTIITKPLQPQQHIESQLGGVTIRAWLAILLIIALCLVILMDAYCTIFILETKYNMDAGFVAIISSVITYYFSKQTTPTTPTPNEKTTV